MSGSDHLLNPSLSPSLIMFRNCARLTTSGTDITPVTAAVFPVGELSVKVEDEKLETHHGSCGARRHRRLESWNRGQPGIPARLVQEYGRKAEEEGIAPAADITVILEKILTMTDERAMEILLKSIEVLWMIPSSFL